MENHHEEAHLLAHDIKPTAVRIRVWRAIHNKSGAFALKDVEEWLPEMDRSSIFRTLRLFAEQKLLHELEDGMGQCKYCICRCEDETHRGHVHFTCVKCGRTYCFPHQLIPSVSLPDDFLVQETEYLLKGICGSCL